MPDAQTRLEDILFRSYWDDGILDLLCGIALIFFGFIFFFGVAYLIGGSLVPLVYLYFVLRRWIVEPRAGFVEFSRRRKRRNLGRLAIAYFILTALFVGAVYWLTHLWKVDEGQTTDLFISGVPGILSAALAVAIALLTGARRFHIYAAILIVSGTITGFALWSPAIPFLCSGAVLLTGSGLLLRRFVRDADAFQETEYAESES